MKNKKIIVLVLILIVLLTAYLYYNYSYPYSGNAGAITEHDLLCNWYYGDYNQKKIGTPDNWKCSLRGTKSAFWHAPNQELDSNCFDNNQSLIGGCAGVQNIYLEECCNNWAAENGVVHVSCIGNWTIEENICSWVCDEV